MAEGETAVSLGGWISRWLTEGLSLSLVDLGSGGIGLWGKIEFLLQEVLGSWEG